LQLAISQSTRNWKLAQTIGWWTVAKKFATTLDRILKFAINFPPTVYIYICTNIHTYTVWNMTFQYSIMGEYCEISEFKFKEKSSLFQCISTLSTVDSRSYQDNTKRTILRKYDDIFPTKSYDQFWSYETIPVRDIWNFVSMKTYH